MNQLPEILALVAEERKRTRIRVRNGELPFMVSELNFSQRVLLITKEMGEVAEVCKSLEGLKDRRGWTAKAMDDLDSELIQILAIIFDWMTERPR